MSRRWCRGATRPSACPRDVRLSARPRELLLDSGRPARDRALVLTAWRRSDDPRPWWALAALTSVLVAMLTTYPTDGEAGFWLVVGLVLLWRVTAGSRTAWLACLLLTAPGAVLFGFVAAAAALPGIEGRPTAHAGLLAVAYALGTLALLAAPVRARVRGERSAQPA